jgi:hypothetical protein
MSSYRDVSLRTLEYTLQSLGRHFLRTPKPRNADIAFERRGTAMCSLRVQYLSCSSRTAERQIRNIYTRGTVVMYLLELPRLVRAKVMANN